jgi:hypothetical protein
LKPSTFQKPSRFIDIEVSTQEGQVLGGIERKFRDSARARGAEDYPDGPRRSTAGSMTSDRTGHGDLTQGVRASTSG